MMVQSNSNNKKYVDKTRFPKVVNPIEEEFEKNYDSTLKELMKAITTKLKQFSQNG